MWHLTFCFQSKSDIQASEVLGAESQGAEAGRSLHNFPAPSLTPAYLALGEHRRGRCRSQDLSKLTHVTPFSWFQSPSLHTLLLGLLLPTAVEQ